MNRIEINYGSAPNYFLEKDATPEQLFEYVRGFYENFANGVPSTYPIGQTYGRHEDLTISSYGGGRGYNLAFNRIGHILLREYDVYKDAVELLFPSKGGVLQKTHGEHAFFITAHLRAAGVISLRQNVSLETSRH